MSLKNLIPSRYPVGTQTPPFEHKPKSSKRRYVKVKELLFDPETSERIYWRDEEPVDEDQDQEHNHGCFCLLKRSFRGTIDKLFGPLFGLLKFDEFRCCTCDS